MLKYPDLGIDSLAIFDHHITITLLSCCIQTPPRICMDDLVVFLRKEGFKSLLHFFKYIILSFFHRKNLFQHKEKCITYV